MATKGKHRVLVVDDEPSVLFTYRMLLEEQGYEVIAALSSEEASTALAEKPFDLVLCDLSLERDRTGFEVIETARKRSPAVSCVLLTGYANKEVADRAQRDGVAVLYKPIDVEELLRTIQQRVGDLHADKTKAKRG
jgi:CheY-like chemotaxis protein